MKWYVYILEATARTGRVTAHVGIALDPAKRLLDHNAGKVKQTRGRICSLLGVSVAMTQGDALRLEKTLKSYRSAKKKNIAALWT